MPEPLTVTIVSVTAITVAAYVYKSIDRMVSAPRELVKQGGESTENLVKTVSTELRKFFNWEPRISVNRTVVQRGGEAVRELALYKESVEIIEEWANTSWKSTKQVQVKQPFTLKAGFDLNRIKLDLDPAGQKVIVTISDSTVVNVEYAGEFEFIKEEHGFWNRITTADRGEIVNSLPQRARLEAEKLELTQKAAGQLKVLLERIVPPGFQIEVRSQDETLYFQDQAGMDAIPAATLRVLGIAEESVRNPE